VLERKVRLAVLEGQQGGSNYQGHSGLDVEPFSRKIEEVPAKLCRQEERLLVPVDLDFNLPPANKEPPSRLGPPHSNSIHYSSRFSVPR
jgi:hypothetical protein